MNQNCISTYKISKSNIWNFKQWKKNYYKDRFVRFNMKVHCMKFYTMSFFKKMQIPCKQDYHRSLTLFAISNEIAI